jgi:hypothetical protein
MSEQIKFYQNNPCLIIRDVNEVFCEIQLNTHFAANIEAEYYCTPAECFSPMSSGERAQEEYDQAQSIIDDIQSEEHSIICMVEKRLLHDAPIEANTINSLQREIDKQKAEFLSTKELHEEWVNSSKVLKLKAESLQAEIKALELSREAELKLRDTAKDGVKKLSDQYSKLLVQIGYGNTKISMHEYNELEKRDAILRALEAGGVDNWDWYDESLKNANL